MALLPLTLAGAVPLFSSPSSPDTLSFARTLSEQHDHRAAALEYRRAALEKRSSLQQAACLWMAAYEYGHSRRWDQAEQCLVHVETVTPDLENEVYLLRGELSASRRRFREALFYWESLVESDRPPAFRRYAARKGASAALALKKWDRVSALLANDPAPPPHAQTALAEYEKGKDKNPLVGGLLGMVPGLGYAYSGEYGNGLRSLLLNALCIWGIVEFADREQWAGVALVGFAELTVYSGSVYGGVDAAVRYNERRLARAQNAVEGNARFEPVLSALPILKLSFDF